MDVLIVAGFLGSGKTTVVLSTVSRAIERAGVKAVIIVNDFGQVGIDGTLMARYGLDVIELASGCVCCTLGPDLLQTVTDLKSRLGPDLIVVEPTGVADPQAIIKALNDHGNGLAESIRAIVVVDASRFDVIMKALLRPMSAQLRSADIILLNKIDLVSDPELKRMEAVLRGMNHEKPILRICATEGENLDRLVDAMVRT